MKTSQGQKIIEYLIKNPSLTSFEAYTELGITQFATRVSELEKLGYEFEKKWDCKINKKGETKHFKKYSLKNMIEENMNHIPRID